MNPLVKAGITSTQTPSGSNSCTGATITLSGPDRNVIARFKEGEVRDYGPFVADHSDKVWHCLDAIRTGGRPICCAKTALPQAVCVSAAHLSPSPIFSYPQWTRRTVVKNGETFLCVSGLEEQLLDCFRRSVLPSQVCDISWATPAGVVDAGIEQLCLAMSHVYSIEVSVSATHARQPA